MKDFLIALEYEGLTSRLKRLSDALLYSTKDLYKSEGLDIEPNWNLIFKLLRDHKEMTITEMSEALQFSHPAVVKIINKMKKQSYIESYCDEEDKRKQVLSLTKKAHKYMKNLEVYWQNGASVVEDLLVDSPHFLEEITKIEEKINQLNYKQRVLLKLNKE